MESSGLGEVGTGFQDGGEGEGIGLDGAVSENLAVEEEGMVAKAVDGVCVDEGGP